MSARPILMSAPMVRALLAGTKSQTRRIVKPQPPADKPRSAWFEPGVMGWAAPEVPSADWHRVRCPYGVPGDTLWVRETWAVSHAVDHLKPGELPHGAGMVYYAATENIGGLLKRPSIFMPRWASRITLEIAGVRVERLQDISEADAVEEGVDPLDFEPPPEENAGYDFSHRAAYARLWEQINGAGSWEANPYVWVIEFKRVQS